MNRGLCITINGCHNETDLCGISGAGKVGIYLLGLGLIKRYEAIQDIVTGSGIILASCIPNQISNRAKIPLGKQTFVVAEIVLHWANGKFLPEPVNFVQEQNNARLDEPSRVADRIK